MISTRSSSFATSVPATWTIMSDVVARRVARGDGATARDVAAVDARQRAP